MKKQAERDVKVDSTSLLNDFKVALAAVTSDKYYKVLEAQFLLKKIEGTEDDNTPPSIKIDDGCFLLPYKVFI